MTTPFSTSPLTSAMLSTNMTIAPFIHNADLTLSCPTTSPTARAASSTKHCTAWWRVSISKSAGAVPATGVTPNKCGHAARYTHAQSHSLTHNLIYNLNNENKENNSCTQSPTRKKKNEVLHWKAAQKLNQKNWFALSSSLIHQSERERERDICFHFFFNKMNYFINQTGDFRGGLTLTITITHYIVVISVIHIFNSLSFFFPFCNSLTVQLHSEWGHISKRPT